MLMILRLLFTVREGGGKHCRNVLCLVCHEVYVLDSMFTVHNYVAEIVTWVEKKLQKLCRSHNFQAGHVVENKAT